MQRQLAVAALLYVELYLLARAHTQAQSARHIEPLDACGSCDNARVTLGGQAADQTSVVPESRGR